MSTIATRSQNARNHGTALLGLCLLVVFSPLAIPWLSQNHRLFSLSGEQVVRALPVATICEVLVRCLPAGGQVLVWCHGMNLMGAAARLLCRAL
jgi:hypothetical protein